ncbi:MAG: hypothetical protein OXG27_04745 [Chloroflexi bacterium]|nr:hypothetical protein [Chloroflexota bacterium]
MKVEVGATQSISKIVDLSLDSVDPISHVANQCQRSWLKRICEGFLEVQRGGWVVKHQNPVERLYVPFTSP